MNTQQLKNRYLELKAIINSGNFTMTQFDEYSNIKQMLGYDMAD